MDCKHVITPDGIHWYTERHSPMPGTQARGQMVLIPSGEGDCHSLRATAEFLSQQGYSTLSFDMPGFSRTKAPKAAYEYITPHLVAKQIDTLLATLSIPNAVLYGCSSGAGAVLALIALYPERVRAGVVHEPPFVSRPRFKPLLDAPDEEVISTCEQIFTRMCGEENDGRERWRALGEDYHVRLRANYLVWVRNLLYHYEEQTNELMTAEVLRRKPLFWTVGGLSEKNDWLINWEVAARGGVEVRTEVLQCKHFPNVTIPDKLAGWIIECASSSSC